MSIYGHGPSAREQQVLDRWERNETPRAIAVELDLSEDYVRRTISMLGAPKGDDWHGAARYGSDSLLRAIRRHHPERCRGVA